MNAAVRLPGPSIARLESNRWLRQHAATLSGDVLSIGSGDDADGQGGRYRDYFASASSYTTSEPVPHPLCDRVLDVCDMRGVSDGSFTGIFCSGVLEHVVDPFAAVRELARVLRPQGVLLLGLPFRQALHHEPQDYWRFTRYGIEELLRPAFRIEQQCPIDESVPGFPSAYWTRALRLGAK